MRLQNCQVLYLSNLRIFQQRKDIFLRQSRAAFCAFEQVATRSRLCLRSSTILSSTAGFHHGSRWITQSAAVRFNLRNTSLKVDKKQIILSGLKRIDRDTVFFRRRGVVQVLIADAFGTQRFAYQSQMCNEPAEGQRLVFDAPFCTMVRI